MSNDLMGPGSDPLTVIGRGCELTGTLTVDGAVRVDGKFNGQLHSPGLVVVSAGALVKADITAGSVLIQGEVEGNVRATTLLELQPPARMVGNLVTPSLAIGQGVLFAGSCEMPGPGRTSQAPEPASPAVSAEGTPRPSRGQPS